MTTSRVPKKPNDCLPEWKNGIFPKIVCGILYEKRQVMLSRLLVLSGTCCLLSEKMIVGSQLVSSNTMMGASQITYIAAMKILMVLSSGRMATLRFFRVYVILMIAIILFSNLESTSRL